MAGTVLKFAPACASRVARLRRALTGTVLCIFALASPGVGADLLRVNGVAFETHTLRSPEAPGVLLARYRRAWAQAGPLTEQQIAGWQVLGHQVGARHETLQVRGDATGGCEALVAVSDVSQRLRRPPAPPIVLRRPVRLLSTVESGAAGGAATEYLARSTERPAASLQSVMRSAQHSGFQLLGSAARSGDAPDSALLHYVRGTERLAVVVQRATGGSSIWIHHEAKGSALP